MPSGVAATADVGFGYTEWGALESVGIANQFTETYEFDSYTRVSSVTKWILGQSYSTPKTYTTSYEYNLGSQLTKLIYPSGQQVVVNHDDKGRLQSLTDDFENPYLTGMSYNIAGQVTGLTLGNGVVESYGYDANRLQLTTQTATKSGNQLMNLTYNYQATAGQMGQGSTAGNAGQLMGITGTMNSTTESAGYTYDLLGRLVTSTQTSNGSSADRQFAYDRWGNRTSVYDGLPGGKNPPTLIQSITLQQSGGAPTNRITSVTSGSTVNYTYDAAGNVTNDGAHTYKYDAENRIVKVDDGTTAEYKYDHQNRRVTKIVGSSWTHYVWEGAQVIGEHDGTTPLPGFGEPPYQEQSARLDYIYSGGRMIRSRQRTSSVGSWTSRYFLSDRLSVRMTLDSTGNVIGRQAHLPFGEDFGGSGTQEKHRFTSYERDSESGLDYTINREHSAVVGRFLQADQYRASGYIVDPQSWNRYSYTRNEPVNRVDPLGLEDVDVENPSRVPGGIPFNGYGAFGPGSYGQLRDGDGAGGQTPSPSCEIRFGTSGKAFGTYKTKGVTREPDINPNRARRGPGTSTDNYWIFFYEVMVDISNIGSRLHWDFEQTFARLETYTIRKPDGSLEEVNLPTQFGPDRIDPENRGWRGDTHFWLDTPGIFMKKRSGNPSDTNLYDVVAAKVEWSFTFEAAHKSLIGVKCERRATVTMRLQLGQQLPSWTFIEQ